MSELFSAVQAAEYLGIKKVSVLDAIKKGRLPSCKDSSGQHRIRLNHLQRYDQERQRGGKKRAALKAWVDGNPTRPDGVNLQDWEMLIQYASDPTLSFEALAARYNLSRQRVEQRIKRAASVA